MAAWNVLGPNQNETPPNFFEKKKDYLKHNAE